MVSNSVKPSGNYVVLDLSPATWYQLRVTSHNNVGFTQAEFEFATLTLSGSKIKLLHNFLTCFSYTNLWFFWSVCSCGEIGSFVYGLIDLKTCLLVF
jgi:hypothetical protein